MSHVETKEIKYFVSPKFQICLMAVVVVILITVFSLSYKGFKAAEEYPPVISLTPQKLFSLGGPASPVRIGLFIKNFSEFDIKKGNFLVDLTIWFKFNPEHISPEVIDKFVFQKAEIKSKSAPFIKAEESTFLVSYDMRVLFHISLNYKNFPIDDHRLSFIVDNYFISPAQGFFETSKNNISVSSEVRVEGWNLIDTAISVGYFENNIQNSVREKKAYYPRAIFFFDMSQAGVRNIFAIFFPLVMIFFMALFSFSVNPLEAGFLKLIDMSAGSLAALIAYRFVMESITPVTGYFIMSDYVFLFFLVAILCIFLINLFGKVITRFHKYIIIVFLHIATVMMFVYLLRPWE